MYRLSDAWKATLSTTDDADINHANLPMMDDPRCLPDLMHLVTDIGDGCVWNRYEEVATKRAFLARGYQFSPGGLK